MQGLRKDPQCCLILIFKTEETGQLSISHISNLLACGLRCESLAASDRPGASGKITTVPKYCQDVKLGPNARAP